MSSSKIYSSSNQQGGDDVDYDACIIGGGIAGCIVARDVASCGYQRIVILEKSGSVGGVWESNDYLGLRLHGLSAPYRSWSVAPQWQTTTNENCFDPLYRPTRSEVFDYIRSLVVDHEAITVRTNSEYEFHQEAPLKEGDKYQLYEVKFMNHTSSQMETVTARTVVFATGVGETLGGEPFIPIDVHKIHQNGPIAIHSSQMSSVSKSVLQNANQIYVVGSSKAAIDVLHHFVAQIPSLVDRIQWVHRGHIIFTLRECLETWMISSNPFLQWLRKISYWFASWCCYHQRFDLIFALCELANGIFTSCERPLTRIPYRSGIESKEVLKEIRATFDGRQILLKQRTEGITVHPTTGVVQFHGDDDSHYNIGEEDVLIFCTGQRRRPSRGLGALTYPSLEPGHNSKGVFTVHAYSQITPVSAVLTGGLMISYLDKNPNQTTLYSSGKFLDRLTQVRQQLERVKPESAWAKTMTYFGGMFVRIQPVLMPGILGDFGFHYRWQNEWFGKDLDVRRDLLPLLRTTKI